MKRNARAILGFAVVPLLGIATPLVAWPAISAAYGVGGWAAVALGQASGLIGATIVELGWGWNGPMRVARARSSHTVAAISWSTRLLVAPVPVILCVAVATLISPDHAIVAALSALGVALNGFSMIWLLIGLRKPWSVLAFDALPRFILALTGALMVAFGLPLWLYPTVGLIAPAITAPIMCTWAAGSRLRDTTRVRFRRSARIAASQISVVLARTTSTAYSALPVLLTGLTSGVTQVATFAAGDRMMRMGLNVLTFLPNSFQSWVGSATSVEGRLKKLGWAIGISAGVGAVCGSALAIFGPFASNLLFSGTATIGGSQALALGLTVLVVSISRATGGIGLVILNRSRALLTSAVIGAGTGVPAVLLGSHVAGAEGAAFGVLAAETAVLAAQLAFLTAQVGKFRRGEGRGGAGR